MKPFLIILIIIAVTIGLAFVFFNCRNSKEYKQFDAEMQKRAADTKENDSVCSAQEISKLPECLRTYCDFIQLEGTRKHNITHSLFRQADFVFNEKKGVNIKMDYDLWIFADRPHREAFCKSSVMGIPFEGIDYFDEDSRSGGMKGYLGRTFQLFDQQVPNMERAMYITLLAENAMLNPSFLLSDFIEYQDIDNTHCRAKITYNGISGEGVFFFDKANGELKFESDQRQNAEIVNGETIKVGWRCEGGNFHNDNNFKIPSYCRVTKIYPDREVIYFNAEDYSLDLLK